jgi:hypothetical protein
VSFSDCLTFQSLLQPDSIKKTARLIPLVPKGANTMAAIKEAWSIERVLKHLTDFMKTDSNDNSMEPWEQHVPALLTDSPLL